jgi:hypothetical protein
LYFLISQGDIFDILPFIVISLITKYSYQNFYSDIDMNSSKYLAFICFYCTLTTLYIGATEKVEFGGSPHVVFFIIIWVFTLMLSSLKVIFESMFEWSWVPMRNMAIALIICLFFVFVPAIEALAFIPRQLYAKFKYDVDIRQVNVVKYTKKAIANNNDSTTVYYHKPFWGYFYEDCQYPCAFGMDVPDRLFYWAFETYDNIIPADKHIENLFYNGPSRNSFIE